MTKSDEFLWTRRRFLGAFGATGILIATGGLSLLTSCTKNGKTGEGGLYVFIVESGATITKSNENTGTYTYKKKCAYCGWEQSIGTTKHGVSVSEEFTCPRCKLVNQLVIRVSQGGKNEVSTAETLASLMYAVKGETQANANYLAFANVADKENYKEIGAVFRAIAEAELKHAQDEFAIAQKLGSVQKPQADQVTTKTTKENLQSAIAGETEEFTDMYPRFIAIAQKENVLDALEIFTLAKQAEEVHAGIYSDVLKNMDRFDKVKYAKIYRCTVCGNIELTTLPQKCSICYAPSKDFIEYDIVK